MVVNECIDSVRLTVSDKTCRQRDSVEPRVTLSVISWRVKCESLKGKWGEEKKQRKRIIERKGYKKERGRAREINEGRPKLTKRNKGEK